MGINAVLHHFGGEDLGQHDMQGWRLVVPVISVIVAGPGLELAVQSQALLQVAVLLQQLDKTSQLIQERRYGAYMDCDVQEGVRHCETYIV